MNIKRVTELEVWRCLFFRQIWRILSVFACFPPVFHGVPGFLMGWPPYRERIHPVLEKPGQALEVVAGGHHGHGHRGSGLSNGADKLAAHMLHLVKGALYPRTGTGNAGVALLLACAQGFAALGLALDMFPIAQGLEHFTARRAVVTLCRHRSPGRCCRY